MGDPNVLKDFVLWAKQKYPAENYILIIWDHGDGWRYTEANIANNELKEMYLQDYRNALVANEKIKYQSNLTKIDKWITEISSFKSDQKKLTSELNSTAKKITILPEQLKEKVSFNSDFLGIYATFKNFISTSLDKIPENQFSFIDKYSGTLDTILLKNNQIENLQKKIESVKIIDTSITVSEVGNLKMGNIEADPVKAVSHDNTDKDILYNKEIHDILTDGIVNIIGFDACLMSMLETGYTLRNKATYLVGSEELEPGNGWNYTLWLGDLIVNPGMSPLELSKNIVENYHKAYQYQNEVTLSAIDLTLMEELARSVKSFSTNLIDNLPSELNNIISARDNCQKYATDFASIHSIDLSLFLYHLGNKTVNSKLKGQSNQIRSLINLLVIANFHSDDRKFESVGISYGSFGIAIYFPKRKDYFDKAYTDENAYYPVEFVKDNTWDNFLQSYFNIQ
jgi:hypothetical protein